MKKVLNSQWTITIVGTVLGFLLTVIYDLYKGNQLFTTVCVIFEALKSGVLSFLTFELQVWWILLGVFLIFAFLIVIAKKGKSPQTIAPSFTTYTEDSFRFLKWSWSWSKIEGKWCVTDLQPHCPRCDTPLLEDLGLDAYQCPRCGFKAKYTEHEEKCEVEAVIIDNVKRRLRAEENS
ncbi:MAG: hypothetical protein HDT15_04010 [Oscillibacter sp.]|nr:hypothetical protein [Oscillibacter sp.]